MRILSIENDGFMASEPTRVALPRSGVVVITGSNGAGKSSLLETVAVSLFGKTLRGAPWWPRTKEVPKSVARVVTDVVHAERTRTGSRSTLKWSINEDEDAGRLLRNTGLLSGVSPDKDESTLELRDERTGTVTWRVKSQQTEYETQTQAQDRLEGVIGTFDSWRRCSAFSSADAAHFSMASDGERKRLLESLLGLERFDDALENCRKDLKAAETAHASRVRELDQARSRLETAEALLEQAVAAETRAKEDVPPEELAGAAIDTKQLEADIRSARSDLDGLALALQQAERGVSRAELLLEQAREASHTFESGFCPTCGEEASVLHEDQVSRVPVAEKAVADAVVARTAARSDYSEAKEVLDLLSSRWDEKCAERREAESKASARSKALSRLNQAKRERADLDEKVHQARNAVSDYETAADSATVKVKVLRHAEVALGLRGIRAHILSKSLAGISAVANVWLPRLGLPELRVALRPYREKKTGGVEDSISLELEGVADGYGYKAASAGERRRVDIAMLLALAEVGQAAAGLTGSTLFFDEAMDAVDEDGVDALCTVVLPELAKDRCVFLISHNVELSRKVPAAARYHVANGVVRQLRAAA